MEKPTIDGWYWYRSTEPLDPASSGDWVVLQVSYGNAEVADMSLGLHEFHGEWRGPIDPPKDDA